MTSYNFYVNHLRCNESVYKGPFINDWNQTTYNEGEVHKGWNEKYSSSLLHGLIHITNYCIFSTLFRKDFPIPRNNCEFSS